MNVISNNAAVSVTSDERLLSLLCHLSSFLGGIILPVIIWATQKDKSKFVRFHSLQAIFFHLTIAALIIILVFLFLVIVFAGIGLSNLENLNSSDNMPPFMIFFMVIFYGGIFLIAIAFLAYSIYLAIKAFNGELIRIPILGNIIYNRVYEDNRAYTSNA